MSFAISVILPCS